VQTFLSSRGAEAGTRWVSGSAERVGGRANESSISRWTWPLLGALSVLALGTFLYNRAPVAPVTAQAPDARPTIAENVKAPAAAVDTVRPTIAQNVKAAAATYTASVQRGTSFALTEQEAKAWVDKPVYSSDGQKLGEVAAFLRTADNKVSELLADIGGFLGMGEHRIRLAPAQFSLHNDRIVLDMTAEQAKELPKIQK